MKKKDLQQAAGISPALIAKLGRNENVSTESLVKICTALHCDIGDIMEIVLVEGGESCDSQWKFQSKDSGIGSFNPFGIQVYKTKGLLRSILS